MSDVMSFEAGFNLYHVGGVGDVWDGRNSRFPLFGRLGRSARLAANASLEFRTLRQAITARLPSFRVAAPMQLGLLAMPRETDEMVRRECAGMDVLPVVVSTTGDGRTLASPLPDGVHPGSAKLLVERQSPLEPRILALPSPPGALHEADGEAASAEIETVLYRFPERGIASVALGLLVGGKTLAMPRAVINRSPVDSMPLNQELFNWARLSGTPIV